MNTDTETITDTKQILREIQLFYENLYSSKLNANQENGLEEFVQSTENLPTLSEEKQQLCEGNITLQECFDCLKLFKNNKSPGCDGLSIEFYKMFWREIGQKLVETLNYSKKYGKLSLSQRRAVITLLHKKGKDEYNIKNWRPVLLLNIDYKIMTKVLAKRMEKVIRELVHPNQSGFIKGRFIGEGIRFLEDLIKHTDIKDIPGLILLLDFEKAFDSVEWEFLFRVLKKFGFGKDYIDWVKVCYCDIYSTVCNNCSTSSWFNVYRGVRQGCPLSCLLFILVAEILAQKVRNKEEIKGIQVGDIENKINQFADDTACTLKNEESICFLFALIEQYTMYSGLRLNVGKTILIWLGPWRNKTGSQFNLQVEKGSFNNLGVHIGRDVEASIENNFNDKVTKMKRQFNIWSGRNLTIFGKILISKTFGISNLVYSMTMTNTPTYVLENAQKEINKFIWNNKPAKIRHSTLIGKCEWGGAKSVDIKIMMQALLIVWVSRLWFQSNWNSVITLYLLQYGGIRFLLQCNYDYKNFEIPDFYKNILRYSYYVIVEPHGNEIIWNNQDIRINNKPIFYKQWFEQGIIFIQDLCKENGDWFSYKQFTTKYDLKNCQLKFMGLINCLKLLLRKNELYKNINLLPKPKIDFDNSIFHTTDGKNIDILKVKSKMVYDMIIERKFEPPVAFIKWNMEIGMHENDFKLSIQNARMSTSDVRLLSFNFKLFHRLVNNN